MNGVRSSFNFSCSRPSLLQNIIYYTGPSIKAASSSGNQNLNNMPKSSKRENPPPRVQYFLDKSDELLRSHGLNDWKTCFDWSLRRAGCCNVVRKTIFLSYHMLVADDISENNILNIILHEIAHALVGVEHGHNEIWKQKAIDIGSDGQRCHSLMFATPQNIIICPCGNISKLVYRVRKEWHTKRCEICSSGVIIYKRNGQIFGLDLNVGLS